MTKLVFMLIMSSITALILLVILRPIVAASETIDIAIKGFDDGIKTNRQQDRREAEIDAKLQAIERAGSEIQSITKVENFQIKFDLVESKAKAVLLPGFKVVDMGYQIDGTYQVVLVGKVLAEKFAAIKSPKSFSRQKSGDIFTNPIGMKFVLIPEGTFMMGSPYDEQGRDNNERQHEVTLTKGFYMQTTEVTQEQWESVMGTRPCSGKKYVRDSSNNPAVYISWNDCQEFIRRLNQKEGTNKYRLPTEAEWEYACRAGSSTRFYFGESESILGDYAWYRNNASDVGERYAHTVAQKQPNAWGLYDMHGNVWEWCQDWYEKDYPSGHGTDPKGPSSGRSRVLRGGGWGHDAGYCRSANRHGNDPGNNRYSFVGFRVARAL